MSRDSDRAMFVVDSFKILKWVYAVQEPNTWMHLVPQVRTKTPNSHYITWLKEGLVKELRGGDAEMMPTIERLVTKFPEDAVVADNVMDIIDCIYRAPLLHVERGRCHTITSIGQTLENAMDEFRGSRHLIVDQVKLALDELHSLGLAHCDVRPANVFVLLNIKRVILGDLEYCRSTYQLYM
ncbi:hypothetical protein DYB37_007950 [Aphanomyces astaci]|uniref:Protein kinase domain-containing protein n=1 Tax=Aphanomyces astaci TaxID=112090 RepID=A0A418F8Q2_APHAT|nr:hypothetical protein DYB37_007950 [Aphanomyces astaci]